jgi:hypothetical protein
MSPLGYESHTGLRRFETIRTRSDLNRRRRQLEGCTRRLCAGFRPAGPLRARSQDTGFTESPEHCHRSRPGKGRWHSCAGDGAGRRADTRRSDRARADSYRPSLALCVRTCLRNDPRDNDCTTSQTHAWHWMARCAFDVDSDGQRFLMLKADERAVAQIHVVLHWFEELKRLVPTK